MNVLMIDVDSKIPNLALMKLSSYHKAQGDKVGWFIPDPDRIYASIIFKKNKDMLNGIHTLYPDSEIIIGGSGYDLHKNLPNEVDECMPDYSLYPGMDYSMGFTSRGCIRHCYFCIVPEKEGKYRRWNHPADFHDPKFKKMKLLDNNWYADKEWFMATSGWIVDHNIQLDVTQGMDIRILDQEISDRLKELRWWAAMHFAFDDESYEEKVLSGIEMLRASKVNVRRNVMFYVYCDSDEHFDSALYRANLLKEHGVRAFVMFNCDNERTQRIKNLQRWANRSQAFWSFDFKDYKSRAERSKA